MRKFKAVPGRGIICSSIMSADDKKFSEYHNLEVQYPCKRVFRDRDKESGNIRDLIDDLTSHKIEYTVYDDKTDKGCTVFYDREINSCQSVTSSYDSLPYDSLPKCKYAGEYEDGYRCEIGGNSIGDCLYELEKLEREHGELVWYGGVYDDYYYYDGELMTEDERYALVRSSTDVETPNQKDSIDLQAIYDFIDSTVENIEVGDDLNRKTKSNREILRNVLEDSVIEYFGSKAAVQDDVQSYLYEVCELHPIEIWDQYFYGDLGCCRCGKRLVGLNNLLSECDDTDGHRWRAFCDDCWNIVRGVGGRAPEKIYNEYPPSPNIDEDE